LKEGVNLYPFFKSGGIRISACKERPIKVAINSSSHYGIENNLKDKGINYIKEAPYWTISKPLYGKLMYMEGIN